MTECEITEIHCMLLASGLNGVHVGGHCGIINQTPPGHLFHTWSLTFDVTVNINGWRLGGVWFTGALGGGFQLAVFPPPPPPDGYDMTATIPEYCDTQMFAFGMT